MLKWSFLGGAAYSLFVQRTFSNFSNHDWAHNQWCQGLDRGDENAPQALLVVTMPALACCVWCKNIPEYKKTRSFRSFRFFVAMACLSNNRIVHSVDTRFPSMSVEDERTFSFPKLPRFPPNIGLFVCYSPNSGHRA